MGSSGIYRMELSALVTGKVAVSKPNTQEAIKQFLSRKKNKKFYRISKKILNEEFTKDSVNLEFLKSGAIMLSYMYTDCGKDDAEYVTNEQQLDQLLEYISDDSSKVFDEDEDEDESYCGLYSTEVLLLEEVSEDELLDLNLGFYNNINYYSETEEHYVKLRDTRAYIYGYQRNESSIDFIVPEDVNKAIKQFCINGNGSAD